MTTDRVEAEALAQMKARDYPETRWAAYQNEALDSGLGSHLQFLAVGPRNTHQEAPEQYPADTSAGLGLEIPLHRLG